MKLRITIEMENAAFEAEAQRNGIPYRYRTGTEAARILRRLADECLQDETVSAGESWPLRDINGNLVGQAKISR